MLVFMSGSEDLGFESALAVALVPIGPATVTLLSRRAITVIASSVARNHHIFRAHLPTRTSNNILSRGRNCRRWRGWRCRCYCRRDGFTCLVDTGVVMFEPSNGHLGFVFCGTGRLVSVSPTAISHLLPPTRLWTIADFASTATFDHRVAVALVPTCATSNIGLTKPLIQLQ